MIKPLTPDDLVVMREAGKVAAVILRKINKFLKPGISTKDIEGFIEKEIRLNPGMEPAFKGFMGYPASCCVSINEEIIHGIPSKRLVADKDLVSIDVGIKYKGLFVDTAYTYIAGRASKLAKRLIKISLKSLDVGIRQIRVGVRVGDVGSAIQIFVEKNNFSIIRKFVGHGIGRELHLPPEVPNFGEPGQGPELKEGLAIAIEPMISVGSYDVDIASDGWTAKTKDNSLSAHFEHTVAITEKGPWVLTS